MIFVRLKVKALLAIFKIIHPLVSLGSGSPNIVNDHFVDIINRVVELCVRRRQCGCKDIGGNVRESMAKRYSDTPSVFRRAFNTSSTVFTKGQYHSQSVMNSE